MDKFLKGRGAQYNPANRFENQHFEEDFDQESISHTQIIEVYPKTILNKVDSPDIGMAYSMNPYQGCEHGCVYCYARSTHNYWGYSAGIDFERKILVKKNASQLLEKKIKHKNWEAIPIMLSGNTDCYQPIEQKLEITRQILKVLWKYRHPVGIITKNDLVLRDLDILQDMAKLGLAKVSISVTTLNEDLRRFLEPRTATAKRRLHTIKTLSEAGVPVNVMMAPIIPGLTEHEIMEIAKQVAEAGAISMYYTIVRLNGDIGAIFEDWLRKTYPDRADKVINKIKDCHGGQLSDSRFKLRMHGEGNIAAIINQQVKLARKKFFSSTLMPKYNLDLHKNFKNPQMKLF